MSSNSEKVLNWKGINNVYKVAGNFFAGQPTEETYKNITDAEIKYVVNMRSIGEADFSSEVDFLKNNNIPYMHLPLLGDNGFNQDSVKKLAEIVNANENILIHCASGNRIAGWYIVYLVQEKQKSFDEAVEIAMESGLSNPGLIHFAKEYLDQN